ncbi:transporter substrate-binding domain-containing protein [Vibrio sp. JC009]|uniref:hypothetical protein n=1 Tax=Vibrio sp. JC009 TaxID=2912314 RepID=UPI0023AFE0DA|nr:hypothetical protein [Vibrio sp. JC009]WED23726.1 transporter substrate-binding domain-containing protein [Vibrio sp. JC009]
MLKTGFKKIICYACSCLALLCVDSSYSDSSDLRIDTFVMAAGKDKNAPASIFRQKLYKELFRRLDVPLVFNWGIPIKRISELAESGKIDGQVARVYEYQDTYPSQLRVNVPIYKQSFIAYTLKSRNIELFDGWRGLQDTSYFVEYRRGVLFAQLHLSDVISSERLSTVTTVEQGLMKLKAKRTDVFIHANLTAWKELSSPQFKDSIISSAVMSSAYMYPYVHKRHKALIPRMESVLLSMKSEGLIKKYCMEAFGVSAAQLCEDMD